MTDEELREALAGLFAYDTGCTDSGIRDESLRARCLEELSVRSEERPTSAAPDPFLARMLRDYWLSEDAIAQGHGTESVLEFTEWLDDRMDITIRPR